MHYSDDILDIGGFRHVDVSVAEQCEDVPLASYYPVDQLFAPAVSDKRHAASLQVGILPWPDSHPVPSVDDKGIHAVAPDCYGYAASFGNQCLDFLRHKAFVYGFCADHCL